ncbi:hypothetical protein [Marinobacterium iners]|uniref:Uncharacterized protein n=1 Tax=Marinobacterium iners DSM 11526 TaxID=1122198 RepID=A0A1H4E6K9_9GAMM|nr:hypothetical protein [Marinobacterium iners]SEA80663.1 hypothetical protein SAMN02745729_107178 [Marinobacterium iners DSM 11526]
MKFIRDKRIMSVLLNEARYLTGIFGGFNLASMAIMASRDLNLWVGVSLFVTAMSTLLLIFSTYLIAAMSGVNELKDHPELIDDNGHRIIDDIDKESFSSISVIWGFGVFSFVLSIFTLCISIGWTAVLGFISAVLIILFIFKYEDKIYSKYFES